MKTRVQKWGNSLALRIPKSFAEEAGLRADTAIELSLVESRLVVPPITPQLLTLEELFAVSQTKIFLASGILGLPSARRSGEAERCLHPRTRRRRLDPPSTPKQATSRQGVAPHWFCRLRPTTAGSGCPITSQAKPPAQTGTTFQIHPGDAATGPSVQNRIHQWPPRAARPVPPPTPPDERCPDEPIPRAFYHRR